MNLFVYIFGTAVTLNFEHIFSNIGEKKKKEIKERNKQMFQSQRFPSHLHVGLRAHLVFLPIKNL